MGHDYYILIMLGLAAIAGGFQIIDKIIERKFNHFTLTIIATIICGGFFLDRLDTILEKRETHQRERHNGFLNGENTLRPSSTFPYQPSFTGNKYKCSVGGCLCRKYEPKSTFNSDCKNCGHHKKDHYEFQ